MKQMDTLASNLFFLLRCQAARHTHDIATRSSRRAISYRRIWSRIERATARLQGEWQVMPGDTVVYWGNAHADALILYFAVARCGAQLLPLERAEVRALADRVWRMHPPRAVIHDEGLQPAPGLPAGVVTTLPELLGVRCHHQERAIEDVSLTSLIDLQVEDGKLVERCYSLAALSTQTVQADAAAHETVEVRDVLFDVPLLAARIFPALARADTVSFS